MKITSVLLKPSIAEVESGFLELLTRLGTHPPDETLELKTYIEKQLRQVHKAKTILVSVENEPAGLLSAELFEDFRMMKLRLRFAERRWRLILSNEQRGRKMRDRIDHVAAVTV